jgi:gas vesicle protein
MGQTPDEIREDIEETRDRMSETAGALGYKADVKTRAKDAVVEKKDAVVSKVTGAMPDTQGVKQGARRGVRIAQENPLGLAIGGVAVGFLAGLLVPSTRVEDERLGEVADHVKQTAKDTGQEALERGKRVAQEAGQAAMETAREKGSEESGELSSTLRDNVQQVASGQQSSPS